MEEVRNVIALMRKEKGFYHDKLLQAEIDCFMENQKTQNHIKELKDEMYSLKATFEKNLNTITSHKHTAHKIVTETEDVEGLPVSHEYRKDVTELFKNSAQFIRKSKDLVDVLKNKERADPIQFVTDVNKTTHLVHEELNRLNNCYEQLEVLTSDCDYFREEDIFNGSLFDYEPHLN